MATKNNFEIELRYETKDIKNLMRKLNKLAKRVGRAQYQKDTYFNPPHKNFLNSRIVKEWFRLRESLGGNSINYKNWILKDGKTTNVCKELESSIKDPKKIEKILYFLGFKKLVIVKKKRKTWETQNLLITIDDVDSLGTFVEIEAKGQFRTFKKAKDQIHKFSTKLKLTQTKRVLYGYPLEILKQSNKLMFEI